jgi:hypothetical protein
MLGVSRGFDEVHLIYRLKHEINSLSPDAAHFLQQVGACHRPWRPSLKGCVLSIWRRDLKTGFGKERRILSSAGRHYRSAS